MVRSFATSAGLLRQKLLNNNALNTNHARLNTRRLDGFLLDQAAPVLVGIFLLVATASFFMQLTTTRQESLASSEENLSMAAQLAVADINLRVSAGENTLQALKMLPAEVRQHGRQFFVVGPGDVIEANFGPYSMTGRPVGQVFAPGQGLADTTAHGKAQKSGNIRRIELADGALASVATRELAGQNTTLLTLQPVEMGLTVWRRHAGEISAILFCFGAVTIAFSLAFYSQRSLARTAGRNVGTLRARFEIALDRGNCGLWDHVIGGQTTTWSRSMCNILGLEEEQSEIPTARIAEALHPEDASPLELAEALVLEGSDEIDHLFRMRHADGHWIWLRMRATIIRTGQQEAHLLGVVMDVTEERQAEVESHRADLRLRDAIESISEAFVLWDENNKLVLCNSKYQAFHQLPPTLVQRGTQYRSVITAANEPRLIIEIDRGSDVIGGARAYEAQFQDGRWLLISERPTKDGGFVSVGTDITARKVQEDRLIENDRQLRITINDLATSREALRKQAKQLTEIADLYLAQKAEAISANRTKAEFLANMNHEIRTPLNAIIGFSEIIEGEVFGQDARGKYREYAGNIRESGVNLLAIINDILDMAHIEAGRIGLDRSPEPLGDLLARAAQKVSVDAAAKNILVEIEPDAASLLGSKPIFVDANAMGQALTHLMRNAVRLSPVGGRVSLRARMQGGNVNIFISDAGCMLTPAEIGILRDPFGHIDGMLENGCKGSGLGVAIARSLVEMHGGTMRMRSSPRIGSMVMLHLPTAPEPVQLMLPMSNIREIRQH